MSKFFLRWIDSWSDSENAQVGASSEYVIEKKIQWLRIIPFILLHIACLAAFWVGVS
ncbi:acyl-CoA desaturase, partial [Acinetobacter baumannii]